MPHLPSLLLKNEEMGDEAAVRSTYALFESMFTGSATTIKTPSREVVGPVFPDSQGNYPPNTTHIYPFAAEALEENFGLGFVAGFGTMAGIIILVSLLFSLSLMWKSRQIRRELEAEDEDGIRMGTYSVDRKSQKVKRTVSNISCCWFKGMKELETVYTKD